MFLKKKGKKPKKVANVETNIKQNINSKEIENENALEKGIPTAKELIAPASFYRGTPEEGDWMKVGGKYARNFVMAGYPSNVRVGWLDALYSYEGDMDTVIHVQPADDRSALDELTAKITQFEAQLATEREKGNIKNITVLSNKISQLYSQRERLEQNFENLFYVQIASNLYTDSKEELDKQTQKIDNKLKGMKMYLMPTYLQQDAGYKTVLPIGKTYLPDKFRNFNSGALTACFPFYNSEIMHETGILCGINLETRTPVQIDFYDRSKLNNSNITVFGQAGSGKTFFVSLLTMRSALRGVRTVIIDPEGEYGTLTHVLNGSLINIAPDSDSFINPFDIEEEYDEKIDREIVDIKAKVSDLLNLISVMAGKMSAEERSIVSFILADLYDEFGFTQDPVSLYEEEVYFNEKTGEVFNSGKKRKMPIFSDFHEKLENFARKENNQDLISLANALKIYKKGGVYDLFDTHTSEELANFKNAPIVTFDISQLEESVLRPIGMYVALSWTWEKFAKKNPEVKKRIVCDEAWMLVNKNMSGFEYTSQFLETCSRRIRKRNGGLLVASQNFIEFANNEQGKAVLTNAVVNIFLRQDSTDIDALQDTFKLSDGERLHLLQAQRGEILIRMNGESTVAYAVPFDFEKQMIGIQAKKNLQKKMKEKQRK